MGAFFIIGSLLLAVSTKGRLEAGPFGPDHWHPGVPTRILPPEHLLLCIQRLLGLLLPMTFQILTTTAHPQHWADESQMGLKPALGYRAETVAKDWGTLQFSVVKQKNGQILWVHPQVITWAYCHKLTNQDMLYLYISWPWQQLTSFSACTCILQE